MNENVFKGKGNHLKTGDQKLELLKLWKPDPKKW